ncbi:MAG: asparagine synthase-related protein [Candidatus Altiarchaeota archaeon]
MTFAARKYVPEKIDEIRREVGSDRVLLALSGGIDSSVCAILAHKAVDRQLTCVFIDTGLMRHREAVTVRDIFESIGIIVRVKDARARFLDSLHGVTDPEEKRLVFRDTFYKVLGETARDFGTKVLIQGTIAADVKETTGGIKTQHNILEQVGIDPGNYGLRIVEPLKDLYKLQVRDVASYLGMPASLVNRIPFPGPALACRVLGEITSSRVDIVRKATFIVEDELSSIGGFQYFAVLLSDKATGIKGGKRFYGDIVAVRSVESDDALTASISEIPWRKLKIIQERITSEIPSVVKVLYDISPKPPSTIEYI